MSADIRKEHYGRYSYPGSFFAEYTTVELTEPTLTAAAIEGPRGSGYFFKDGWFAVEITTVTLKRFEAADGAEVWVRQGTEAVGKWIVGRLVHFEADELAGDEHNILRSNIRSNSRDPHKGYGVLTRCGNWQIASDYTAVVSAEDVTA